MANQTDWYDYLEDKIFNKVSKYIEHEYDSDVYCTTDESNAFEAEFPTVWIHVTDMQERGMDLTNQTLNAVLLSMQIDIYDSDRENSKELGRLAVAAMKSIYNMNTISAPITIRQNPDTYHTVARFRRMIGGADTIQ